MSECIIAQIDNDIIINFNNELSNKNIIYSIQEYLELIHKNFYNDIKILSCFNLLKLVKKDNIFCINFRKDKSHDIENLKSKNIKQIIRKNKLIKGIDYIKQKYYYKKIFFINIFETIYVLKPDALKKCLLNNQNKFIKYYLFLEKIIYFYQDYQNKQYDTLIKKKDIMINNLNEKIKKQEEYIRILKHETDNGIENENTIIYDNLLYLETQFY
jgi:hypothetical protein